MAVIDGAIEKAQPLSKWEITRAAHLAVLMAPNKPIGNAKGNKRSELLSAALVKGPCSLHVGMLSWHTATTG